MTGANVHTQDIQGIQYYEGKHENTRYIGLYKVHSMTIGYTGYTVLLRETWVHRIYRGIQYY